MASNFLLYAYFHDCHVYDVLMRKSFFQVCSCLVMNNIDDDVERDDDGGDGDDDDDDDGGGGNSCTKM